ncbi:MAG TPA: hypothetical protein VKR58_07440 [Aquella sp.]|nr:hypothetical protein [Aquella sp.]
MANIGDKVQWTLRDSCFPCRDTGEFLSGRYVGETTIITGYWPKNKAYVICEDAAGKKSLHGVAILDEDIWVTVIATKEQLEQQELVNNHKYHHNRLMYL